MAKLKGIIKIEGTLDNLTFYKSQDEYLVRTKSSLTADRIYKDPAFVRTLENSNEFSHAIHSAKLLFDAVRSLSKGLTDARIFSRMTTVMTKIKKLDTSSARGLRNVATGLKTPEGMNTLLNFNFNKHALLETILKKRIVADSEKGTISIADLSAKDIVFPAGATHAVISGARAFVDFESGESALIPTDPVKLDLNRLSADVLLSVPALPQGNGIRLCLVKIAFLQELNGVEYSLQDGVYNSLAIVEVG